MFVTTVGDHRIDVSYVNMAVPGSPFTARAWEASKVIVSGIRAGRVGKENSFNSKLLYNKQRQLSPGILWGQSTLYS